MSVDLLRFTDADQNDPNKKPSACFQMASQSFRNFVELARLYGFAPGPTQLPPGPWYGSLYEAGWHSNDGAIVSSDDARQFAAALRAAIQHRPRLDWNSATETEWGWEAEDYDHWTQRPASPNTGKVDWPGVFDPEDRKHIWAFVRFLDEGSFSIY